MIQGGSKEASAVPLAHFVAQHIDRSQPFARDVVFDDRTALTIGKKLVEAKRVGYPYIIIAGKKSTESVPKLELHDLKHSLQADMTTAELFQYLNCQST